MSQIAIIGAGLAGTECALQLAKYQIPSTLFEQKPHFHSPAHHSPQLLAELVCSNSLRSNALQNGVGLLKQEMRQLGSFFMTAADQNAVPADQALAVDRTAFSLSLTQQIKNNSLITLVEKQISSLNDPALKDFQFIVIATGPLISDNLAESLSAYIGQDYCHFYDAIAPIIWTDSLNKDIIFRASRHNKQINDSQKSSLESSLKSSSLSSLTTSLDSLSPVKQDNFSQSCEKNQESGSQNSKLLNIGINFEKTEPLPNTNFFDAEGDYLNCPFNREEYENFHQALLQAEKAKTGFGEEAQYFEGCLPIETLAERGLQTLAFGPFKPRGLIDPRTGKRPYAVLQLRFEKQNQEACNLVGCQTRMLQKEQARVFRLVPGLENAEFMRYGSMHRNTCVDAPKVLDNLHLRRDPRFLLAGQIAGVEGYVESAACGLWAALSLVATLQNRTLPRPPLESAFGSLLAYLSLEVKNFQPSNAHFGLMPALNLQGKKLRKKDRRQEYAKRGQVAFLDWLKYLQ